MGCHFLLQGIFPTQALNLCFLHCRWILYPLSHQGSPYGTPTQRGGLCQVSSGRESQGHKKPRVHVQSTQKVLSQSLMADGGGASWKSPALPTSWSKLYTENMDFSKIGVYRRHWLRKGPQCSPYLLQVVNPSFSCKIAVFNAASFPSRVVVGINDRMASK